MLTQPRISISLLLKSIQHLNKGQQRYSIDYNEREIAGPQKYWYVWPYGISFLLLGS